MFLEDEALHKKRLEQLPSYGGSGSGSITHLWSTFLSLGAMKAAFFIGASYICAISESVGL